ncbi:unnamed protein product, partial [marine sediment metagenome]
YTLPYFGESGLDANGNSISDHTGPAAVSSIACIRGFNLQKWFSNLILNVYPVGTYLEQLLGRTHRYGQTAPAVYAQMLFTAKEQVEGFEQACRDAKYIEQTTGQKQKLVYADYL